MSRFYGGELGTAGIKFKVSAPRGEVGMLRKSMMVDPQDSVAMLLEDGYKGDFIDSARGRVELLEDIEFAHKILLIDLKKGDPIIKYGEEIGRIMADTAKGTWIHNHNMSCLRGTR